MLSDALVEEAQKNETLKRLLEVKEANDKRREEQRAAHNKTFWESNYDSAYSVYKIVRNRLAFTAYAHNSIRKQLSEARCGVLFIW